MSKDGYGIKLRRNIAESFNSLSRAHERYRWTTDGFTIAKTERNVVMFRLEWNWTTQTLKLKGIFALFVGTSATRKSAKSEILLTANQRSSSAAQLVPGRHSNVVAAAANQRSSSAAQLVPGRYSNVATAAAKRLTAKPYNERTHSHQRSSK